MAGAPAIPDYELLRPIGRGAYGEVWLVRSVTGIYRAAKIIYRATFEEARPFEREFEGVQRFEPLSRTQQNLISVLHVGRNDDAGYFYYLMELADDAVTDRPLSGTRRPDEITAYRPKTLKEVLSRRRRIPVSECLPITVGLCNALHHLHEHRLIHRDVKPSNIIFIDGAPRLADLGLLSGIDATGSFVGTEGYVPKEGPGTAVADLYSLGKVLYEMSTGRSRQDFPLLPEDFESFADRTDLLELNEVVVRACADRAADRYSSAADMRSELLLLQAGKSVKRLHAAERRLKRLVPIVAGACVLAGIALFIQNLQTRSARERARVESEFRQRAEAQELATRQLLYAADMNLVDQAVVAGDLGRARTLLEAHVPGVDQTDLRGFEWHYFWRQCEGTQLRTLSGHSNIVHAVAFSPDGRQLVTASYDRTVRTWRVGDGRLETSIPTESRPSAIGFLPDGSGLVISDLGGNLEIKNIHNGSRQLRRRGVVVDLAVCPVGELLAVATEEPSANRENAEGSGESKVSLWNSRTGDELYSLVPASRLAVFSRDGKRLATGGSVRTIKIWDLDTRRELVTIAVLGPRSVPCFSPDGRWLAIGEENGHLSVRNAETGVKLNEVVAHEGGIWSVAFAPDGRRIATASTDQTVRLFDAPTLAEATVFRGHVGEVWSVAFSPDGALLASGSKDGTARIWSANQSHDTDVVTRRVEFWNWPVFSDDGGMMAVGEDYRVKVRRVGDGSLVATLSPSQHPIGFTGGGDELLAVGIEGDVQQWNWRVDTNRPSWSVAAGLTKVRAHALSPKTDLLAVGTDDGVIQLWNVKSKVQLSTWNAHSTRITSLGISPDGRSLASGSVDDETAKLWTLPDGKLKRTLIGHKLGVFDVVYSPNGRLLASSSVDDTCRLWDPETGNPTKVLTGHKGGAYHAAFSPDGRTLVVGMGDNRVKLWNLPTFRDLGTIEVEPGSVFFTGFVPGQPTLATVSFDFARTNCSLRLLRALPVGSPHVLSGAPYE